MTAFRLRALGRVDLTQADGTSVDHLLAQPKPLALLLYLALAAPDGRVRRDHLVALFWPELDQEHARSSLRKACHTLRRALGDQSLTTRGDEELGLMPGAVHCDAIEFSTAVESDRLAQAMILYRGDLLDGFYVRGSAALDQWIEQERQTYRKRAATAAWILAARAESDSLATVATDWANRAVVLAPMDERIVRKTLALLGRVGDRAGALELFEKFRRRLADEYGVGPAPETVALMQQLSGR
jgi:DNA-binding SARP family transcriptional activator